MLAVHSARGNRGSLANAAEKHFKMTASLAAGLKRPRVYEWLVAKGYFAEPYVLPPCFEVTVHPKFGKVYFRHKRNSFRPEESELLGVHFPKTELTDRTLGIIQPHIHSDIATAIARNWKKLLGCLFHKDNKVCSYSFPIPLDRKKPGTIGRLRSGRLIYEFIEMAEHDTASLAYRYKYLITTDVKNFYPSIYTHSIPWAIHGKKAVRAGNNRWNYDLFGNRLDKLFQSANEGYTNGIPIGPVVSDLIAEVILSGVDRALSKGLNQDVFVVRFKDDYRILAKTEEKGKSVIKALQVALKEFSLELNEEKTELHKLPNGLFRAWVSQYHSANPRPKSYYNFKRFKEVYLAVVTIDRNNPGSGVIDRFLADLVTKKYRLRISLNVRSLPVIISMLLTLGDLRTKAFPKVLAILEAILRSPFGRKHSPDIEEHLVAFLNQLSKNESEYRYLIAWIIYFLRANGLDGKLKGSYKKYKDPIVRAICTSRFVPFKKNRDFKVFQGIRAASKKTSMLEHLDVFKP